MRRAFAAILLFVNLIICFRLPGGEASAALAPVGAGGSEESAGFLFDGRETALDPEGEKGPWLYESDGITVSVTRADYLGMYYYVADIRLRRGERVFGGFARQKPPGRDVEMPYRIARRYGAVLGFTGDFLCHHANPKGVMIRDREVYYDLNGADMLAVFADGAMDVFPAGSVRAAELLDRDAVDVFAFGPILVMDGEVYSKIGSHRLFPNNIRTGIGLIEPGHCVAVVSTGAFTLRQFAQLFRQYGCVWAYNLDGGHSASMVFMGEQLNVHGYLEELSVFQRPLPDFIMTGHSALVPAPEDPIYYQGNR